MALLGGVARLFQDIPAEEKISKRDWLRYCSASLLSGIILATVLHHHYGLSPLLLGVAGLGGFGATQFLGMGVKICLNLSKKIFNDNKKP